MVGEAGRFLGYRGRSETELSQSDRKLLDEMEKHGIPTGSYNLPDGMTARRGEFVEGGTIGPVPGGGDRS